jgi:hypothetical protein
VSGEALDQRPAAPFTDDSPVHPGNRPANRPYRTASKRFELRLTAAQLDAWRTIAARQDVSLADLVRVAVVLAGELPPGQVRAYIERAEADRVAAASESPGRGDPHTATIGGVL